MTEILTGAHFHLKSDNWADESTQSRGRRVEKEKEVQQVYSAALRFCLKLALVCPQVSNFNHNPWSMQKAVLKKGKLTSEMQDSLESTISLVENKFSLAFKKYYTVNALVAESN